MKISNLTKANFYLKLFSITKIPLIWFCKPKIVRIDDEVIEVKIKLNRRTKNHLNSMYFGALSVGADITGGFLAMYCIKKSNKNISLVFKDFKADFLKRPLGNVHFHCNQGYEISNLVNKTIKSRDRQNLLLNVDATVPSVSNEIVAKFQLTLSLKNI
ncbi:MAG: DUF4442 domain-containing protein [Candidatus Marinimicrobia bacterium]|nr:DUF4442 domain-containing protein [Candidatus Neomarinimicrobiota bacterium]